MKAFFGPPGMFDGLVNLLVQQIAKSPIRPHICDTKQRKYLISELVTILMDLGTEKNLKLHDFKEVMEHIGVVKLKLRVSDLSEDFQEALQKQAEQKARKTMTEEELKQLNGNFIKRDQTQYKLYLRGYHKKCCHHWRPEDIRRVGLGTGDWKGFNTGGLLWGEQGCGKSQILAYVTAWAHENSWINITIPSCDEFVDGQHHQERMENGLYNQFEFA